VGVDLNNTALCSGCRRVAGRLPRYPRAAAAGGLVLLQQAAGEDVSMIAATGILCVHGAGRAGPLVTARG